MTRRPAVAEFAVLVAALTCGFAPQAARSQENAAVAYEEWRTFEPSPELGDYRTQLREGVFGDTEKKILTTIALPQLGLPKNRPTIDKVRRRMIDRLFVVEGGDATAAAEAAVKAMRAATEFMTGVARDAKADPVHRVNAVLLVGELRSPGTKPWAEAVRPLTALVADDKLPPEVRIAAAAGLARHVDADPAAAAAAAGPALLAVATSALQGVDPVAADWLRCRALAMLARMGAAAPAGSAKAAAEILVDPARPVDVRVRAAAAAGACAKAAADTDATAAIQAIRDVAAAGLAATRDDVERRAWAGRLAGDAAAPPAGLPPGGPDAAAASVEVRDAPLFRRDAWRLATLADAVAPAAGDGGLARFAGPSAAAATALAAALRQGAGAIDASPDAAALEAAQADLDKAVVPAAAAAAPKAAEPAAAKEPDDGFPFGDR